MNSQYAKKCSLTHKVGIVTGGASGLGASFVERCFEAGAAVAILDIDEPAGMSAVERLRQAGVATEKLLIIKTDTTRRESVADAFDAVSRAYFASKAGLIHLTRALAAQCGPRGLRVNCIGAIGLPPWAASR